MTDEISWEDAKTVYGTWLILRFAFVMPSTGIPSSVDLYSNIAVVAICYYVVSFGIPWLAMKMKSKVMIWLHLFLLFGEIIELTYEIICAIQNEQLSTTWKVVIAIVGGLYIFILLIEVFLTVCIIVCVDESSGADTSASPTGEPKDINNSGTNTASSGEGGDIDIKTLESPDCIRDLGSPVGNEDVPDADELEQIVLLPKDMGLPEAKYSPLS